MRRFFIALTRNPLSLVGSAIATASAVLIVTLFSIELFGFLGNPYIGILTYLVMPVFLLTGLALIPLGILRERKRSRRAERRGEPEARFPVIDLNVDRTRTWVMTVVLLTAINIVILATATFKGVEVMESVEFCGMTCHSVMEPEHTAYERSPHSRVKCVDCHIGPGADWFVKSKLSGAWQVVSVAFGLYPRPIPTPVHDLRPARETCEQCHWPTKFVGDRLWVRTHYADDEPNTELKTILVLRVGGLEGLRSHGIHWHVDPDVRIRYRSDPGRLTMHEVELTRKDGTVVLYHGPEPGEGEESEEWRVMDCVDCHNRPTHVYDLPEQAVDRAIEQGRIARELPFIRREGVRALRAGYASSEEARAGITRSIAAFYESEYPDLSASRRSLVAQATEELAALHAGNVFPAMNVDWGTYPDHGGHMDFPGCFRCHSGEHVSEEGEEISQDCETCHAVLAWEEEDPEVLATINP